MQQISDLIFFTIFRCLNGATAVQRRNAAADLHGVADTLLPCLIAKKVLSNDYIVMPLLEDVTFWLDAGALRGVPAEAWRRLFAPVANTAKSIDDYKTRRFDEFIWQLGRFAAAVAMVAPGVAFTHGQRSDIAHAARAHLPRTMNVGYHAFCLKHIGVLHTSAAHPGLADALKAAIVKRPTARTAAERKKHETAASAIALLHCVGTPPLAEQRLVAAAVNAVQRTLPRMSSTEIEQVQTLCAQDSIAEAEQVQALRDAAAQRAADAREHLGERAEVQTPQAAVVSQSDADVSERVAEGAEVHVPERAAASHRAHGASEDDIGSDNANEPAGAAALHGEADASEGVAGSAEVHELPGAAAAHNQADGSLANASHADASGGS